ncbi:hypothetical protein KY347_04365 [Candidatus Woesearchaeota archaeon]|nr:hypothetical protein [Candidatus Woesearchaeota archaeon]
MHKMELGHKIQLSFGILLISALIVSLFYKPAITGYVPTDINRQKLKLELNESQNFILASNNITPFTVTSFRISGEIIGEGQVKIYIDTGKGQTLLVYENIGKKGEYKKGLVSITSMAAADKKSEGGNKENGLLVITPLKPLLTKEVFDEVGNFSVLVNGVFTDQCIETCFINMEISKEISYRLVFLIEKGTILKVNEIVYQTLDESVKQHYND